MEYWAQFFTSFDFAALIVETLLIVIALPLFLRILNVRKELFAKKFIRDVVRGADRVFADSFDKIATREWGIQKSLELRARVMQAAGDKVQAIVQTYGTVLSNDFILHSLYFYFSTKELVGVLETMRQQGHTDTEYRFVLHVQDGAIAKLTRSIADLHPDAASPKAWAHAKSVVTKSGAHND